MTTYLFGPYRLEPGERRLTRDAEDVRLPPKAFELLCVMVERAGRLVTRAEILSAAWPGTSVDDAAVAVHIMALRRALPLDGDAALIETVPRAGYRFLPIVTIERPAAAAEPSPPAPVPPARPLPQPARGSRTLVMSAVAVAVAAAVLSWLAFGPGSTPATALQSLAVLPFTTIGATESQTYFEIGMADAIITRLAEIGAIRVPSTATVRYFANRKAAPLDAGREMGVDAILTGTLQHADSRIRVSVQALRVADGAVLWSGRFDESATGVFALQDAITEQIASHLMLQAPAAGGSRVRGRRPASLQAYQAYLRGRELWAQRNAANIKTAMALYEEAIALEPTFALAYSGLADAYAVSVSGLPALERMPKAKAAAERALALDPTLPEAHNSLGFIQYKWEWKWAESAASFRKAIELDPNFELAHHWYGESLSLQDQHEEALRLLRRARELNKYNFGVRLDLANALGRADLHEEALVVIKEGMALDPNAGGLYGAAANALRSLNRPDEAIELLLRGRQVANAPAADITRIRETYATEGFAGLRRFDIAQGEAAELAQQGASRAPTLAQQYAEEGNSAAALKWIGVSFGRRDDGPLYLRSRAFDFMRDDPRFKAFEARVAVPR
jgi:TolB-like protein/DNA-binding winged helix-turn-helix (wHTH) protein